MFQTAALAVINKSPLQCRYSNIELLLNSNKTVTMFIVKAALAYTGLTPLVAALPTWDQPFSSIPPLCSSYSTVPKLCRRGMASLLTVIIALINTLNLKSSLPLS